MSCLLVRSDVVRCQPGSAEIHLHLQIARDHAMILKFNSPSRIITGHKLVAASYADGSGGPFSRPARLRRARSPVRTSPLASELPLTCEALPFAGAALPLTCPPAAANPSSFAALTTPGGLRSLRSASSLSFLVILLPQNNSLTFVRGADRACCAPRKRRRGLTYAPRKWSWRPTKARLYQ